MSKPPPALLPDEKILWRGRPRRGLLFQRLDVILVPFSLLWTMFVSSGIVSIWQRGVPIIPLMFSTLFLIVGLYFLFGRFIVDAWNRRSIEYTVTDRRVVVSGGLWGKETRYADIGCLPAFEVHRESSGRGTIRFGPPNLPFGKNVVAGSWTPSLDRTLQFLSIDDVDRVYSIIALQRDNIRQA